MPDHLVRLDFFCYAACLQQFRHWYAIDRRVDLEVTLAWAVSALAWAQKPDGDLKSVSRQDIADTLGIDPKNHDAMFNIMCRTVELGLIMDGDDGAADGFINRMYEIQRQWSIRNDLRFYRPRQTRLYWRNIAVYILGVPSRPTVPKQDLARFFRLTAQQVTNVIDEISEFLAVRHGIPIIPRKPEPSSRTVEAWHRFRLCAYRGEDPVFIKQYHDGLSEYRKTRADQPPILPPLGDDYWLKPSEPPSWFINWYEDRIGKKSVVYQELALDNYAAKVGYDEHNLLADIERRETERLGDRISSLLSSIPSLNEIDDPFPLLRKVHPELAGRRVKIGKEGQ